VSILVINPIKLALIYGSAREGRFCDKVADWAAAEIRGARGFALDLIDPARLDLALGGHGPGHAALANLARRIDAAEGFVIVTPEYNRGYPAPLKALIDSCSVEWHAKPVGFISYGGVSGGLRAVEQLRLVFAELHAVTLRDSVSFANPWGSFDRNGRLVDPEEGRRALSKMLGGMRWWAATLREGRRTEAYTQAYEVAA
jgi:NAD(P)H-dependent FMN reductase